MKRSDIKELPEYFDYYINLNEDISLEEAFNESIEQIDEIDINHLKRVGLQVYSPGKWTIHKILQHLIDWERIWCYRAIVSVRKEGSIPEGLEQDIMAENSNADTRSIEQLIAELRAVRLATKLLFSSFSNEILSLNCRFYNYQMSTLAIAFSIIGHQIHHFRVIKEKYLDL